jgi:hypothetical protein
MRIHSRTKRLFVWDDVAKEGNFQKRLKRCLLVGMKQGADTWKGQRMCAHRFASADNLFD